MIRSLRFLRQSKFLHPRKSLPQPLRPFRHSSTAATATAQSFVEQNQHLRKPAVHYDAPKYLPIRPTQDVYVNSELALSEIQVVGFDYDYTLAHYTDELPKLLYHECINYLVNTLNYPKDLQEIDYDANFSIRGLHYDLNTGFLMKLDDTYNIQPDSVLFGRYPISDQKILEIYGGWHVSREYEKKSMRHLSDLFSLPESCLLADVIQYFLDNSIPFDARYIMQDLSTAVGHVHRNTLHSAILQDYPKFLNKKEGLGKLVKTLKDARKQVFLLTNSPWAFVNPGMTYLFDGQMPNRQPSSAWYRLFDVVICSAGKPDFYSDERPFRKVNPETGLVSWNSVHSFESGRIYMNGSLAGLRKLKGQAWGGPSVVYFGDHLYADLKEPARLAGWKTGVILKELEREVTTQATEEHQKCQQLMEEILTELRRPDPTLPREVLMGRLREIKEELKALFNPNFGSPFKTYTGPTLFASSVTRYADIYTSDITNLLHFPMNHIFWPPVVNLPHDLQPASKPLSG